MLKVYRIAESNLAHLKNALVALNKKAAKLGAPAIELTLTGEHQDETIRDEITNEVKYVRRFVFATVSGEAPKINGWSLAAVVEHTEGGNLLRKAPGCSVELNQFREGAQHCDHCKQARVRRDTFVVIHDDGALKMVGSNCIKDFLGHKDPAALARMAELVFSAGELCEGAEDSEFFGCGGSNANRVYVDGFLAYSACVIRRCGFVSSKRAKESQETNGNLNSTAQTASTWMNPWKGAKLGKDYFLPEDCDKDAALVAKQHVLDTLGARDAASLSDFEHNLLLVCRCESVERRNAGILAFIPEYYARSVQEAKQREEATYFGEVKKRVRGVALTYIKSTGWDSQYGWTFLHMFSGPNGSRISWKTSTQIDLAPSAVILATFTVKAHEEYKGSKQTKVTRLEFSVPAVELAA